MADVIRLHEPLSEATTVDIHGETFVNVAGIMAMARAGDTPECRALTRFFAAELRALGGSPLIETKREEEAFGRAWARLVRKFGVPPIARWDNPPPAPVGTGGKR